MRGKRFHLAPHKPHNALVQRGDALEVVALAGPEVGASGEHAPRLQRPLDELGAQPVRVGGAVGLRCWAGAVGG
jgi:hypothetical protein